MARREGLVWLVDGGFPGDRVLAIPEAVRPRLVEARVERWIEPSEHRRAAPCPIQGSCGGCPWMVLSETEQRAWKRRIVEDALARIGGLRGVEVEEAVASPSALGYRNKVELTFGRGAGGERILGFHRSGNAIELVDVECCLLQDEGANRVLLLAREYFLDGPGKQAKILDHPRERVRFVIRRSQLTGRLLVAFGGGDGAFPEAEEFARIASERCPELASVARIVTREGRRGGARTIPLAGPPWIEESLAGIVFRLDAATFCQVNPGAAERLVEQVIEMAGPVRSAHVVDLYGGVGVFALALSHRGARAVVCEADSEAVACGRRAAREHGPLRVRFVRSDVEHFVRGFRPARPPDLLVADPPRSGLGRGVADGIARIRPERVILVSCDPATLARDARALASHGYSVLRVVPVDMFPQTPHVEVAMLLARGGAGDRPPTATAPRSRPRAGSPSRASG